MWSYLWKIQIIIFFLYYFFPLQWRDIPHRARASSSFLLQVFLSSASFLYLLIFNSNEESLLMFAHCSRGLPTGFFQEIFHSVCFKIQIGIKKAD